MNFFHFYFLFIGFVLNLCIINVARSAETYVVSATGQCVVKVSGSVQLCKKVFYMHTSGGRTNINTILETGSIGFSGGRDMQPNPEYYILVVDRLVWVVNGNPSPIDAKGKCEMTVSRDGNLIKSIIGAAVSDLGNVSLTFKGDGKKIKRLSVN